MYSEKYAHLAPDLMFGRLKGMCDECVSEKERKKEINLGDSNVASQANALPLCYLTFGCLLKEARADQIGLPLVVLL